MASPIDKPRTYDFFLLISDPDQFYSPGPISEAKLDPRAVEIADQQQPGFAGAIAVQKLEKIWTGTYTYRLWSTAHFADDKRFVATLRAGMKKGGRPTGPIGTGRRARVWQLYDARIIGLDIRDVMVEEIHPIVQVPGKQLWTRTIKFHEWKRPVQLPLLPVQQTETEKALEREIKATEAERRSLGAELVQMKKAA